MDFQKRFVRGERGKWKKIEREKGFVRREKRKGRKYDRLEAGRETAV